MQVYKARKEDIDEMARHAAKEANPLYPVPKLLTRKELESFYYTIGNVNEKITINRRKHDTSRNTKAA